MRWTMCLVLALALVGCDKAAESGGEKKAPEKAGQAEPAPAEEGAATGEAVAPEAAEAEAVEGGSANVGASVEVPEEVAKAAGDLAAGLGDKVDAVKGLADGERPPLDAATYERLLLEHASCEITDKHEIDPKCPAVVALREAMTGGRKMGDLTGGGAGLGQRLIGHESPAVRIKAAGLMASFLGTGEQSQAILVEAARKETHPAVLREILRTVANDGVRNPAVGELLLWAAAHESAVVRRAAVFALSSTWNRELVGGPEKLADIAANDADEDLRATACEYAGKLGNDAMMPVFEKLTGDKANEKLYNACLKGLVAMWWTYPFHDNMSEAAYKLTLKRLGEKPRTQNVPAWTVPGSFSSKADDAFAKWEAEAKWYKAKDLMAVLVDIVKDEDANWMGRTGAVKSLAAVGMSKGEFEKLRDLYPEDAKGNDSHVRRALSEAIEKMP